MSQNSVRAFLLRPAGGLNMPRGVPPTRIACIPAGEGEVRIVVTDHSSHIVVQRPDGSISSDEVVRREVAEALLDAFGERVLQHHTVDIGDHWIVRIYSGALWGLVIGLYLGDQTDIEPPTGWHLGEDVTDNPAFRQSTLSHLREEEAQAFLQSLEISVL